MSYYISNDAILKIQRPVKVQPIDRVWYANEKQQVQYACPLPLLSFSSDTNHLTKLGTLSDYEINNIKIKHKPKIKINYCSITSLSRNLSKKKRVFIILCQGILYFDYTIWRPLK
ncbi:DNA replication terminus site-binding protein [Candidatus Arsenophonus triatominarum]|uniref:DNA replication terminus site-binding protein n=1 Tax=Candidatus Arsenophonus triatominarum TaxID=57911 RepID=UPI001FDEDBAF|nr:DNA replication terminus site-binding protein [Candidatus Arsenophonus triatominarum]